jgi:hypothetical protein
VTVDWTVAVAVVVGPATVFAEPLPAATPTPIPPSRIRTPKRIGCHNGIRTDERSRVGRDGYAGGG